MAPNKKKNGFFIFMKEIQEQEKSRGRTITMTNMPNYAHPMWLKLSVTERQRYEDEAKSFNKNPALRGRLASDGVPIEVHAKRKLEIEQAETLMKNSIRAHVSGNMGLSEEEFIDANLKKSFYFLSFNTLCEPEGEAMPNEVGLVEYCLELGITNTYNTIFHPGKIPTGLAASAKEASAQHEIDIYGEDSAEDDLLKVLRTIKEFPATNGGPLPPFFTPDADVEKTKRCLKYLKLKTFDKMHFTVWGTKYLLMELRAGVGDPYASVHLAANDLTSATFDYNPATRCEFHDQKDVRYCALAYSKKLCYLLSDALCNSFKVDLTENHLPAMSAPSKPYCLKTAAVGPKRSQASAAPMQRLDERSSYYSQGSERTSDTYSVFSTPSTMPPRPANQVPQQPANQVPRPVNQVPRELSYVERMAKLNMTHEAAMAPAQGIGRGQRRAQ